MTWFKNLMGSPPGEDVTLEDLDITSDPGTEWHPAAKELTYLYEAEVEEHMRKPEAADQPDAGLVLDHDGEDEGAN